MQHVRHPLCLAPAFTALCIHWKWGQDCIYFSSRGRVRHCVLVKLTFSQWADMSRAQTGAVPHISPVSRLVFLPLCWSISLHDDQRYISHVQASFLHWLWQGQTLRDESLMRQLKKWKHNTCMSEALKWHHKAWCADTDAAGCLEGGGGGWGGSWVQGGGNRVLPALWEEGGPLRTFLQTPRSCWQECVNFKFQLSK